MIQQSFALACHDILTRTKAGQPTIKEQLDLRVGS